MPESLKQVVSAVKDPSSYAWVTYVWVFGLAMLGGLVSFFRKVQKGEVRPWNAAEFIGEIVTSAFAGIITFWLCEWAAFHPLMTAAFVGISGHMGSRALFMFERMMSQKFGVDERREP
jgi:hypothetical protein